MGAVLDEALGGLVEEGAGRGIFSGSEGIGAAGVAAARAAGATLVVTCDCGTSAHEPVGDLMRAGIDVIVTDHHLPGHGLPPALAVCNPRHPACGSADKDLAAVGGYQANDHVEGRCLAGAVRTEQAYNLTAAYLQRGVVYYLPALVALGQMQRL